MLLTLKTFSLVDFIDFVRRKCMLITLETLIRVKLSNHFLYSQLIIFMERHR